MNPFIYQNLANAIVAFRMILIFVVILLFESGSGSLRILGLLLLIAAAVLDGIDGYVAQQCGIVSSVGAKLDTLGDRLTENLLFVYFACRHIIPLYVPLFFITRSLLADFIRSLNFTRGCSTFSIHASPWGKRIVSSKLSRALYLCMKIMVFLLGGILLIIASFPDIFSAAASRHVTEIINPLVLLTVLFSFLRFVLLVWDSRAVLAEAFQYDG
jgi:phosphatidylglycerophosphate synthase